MEKGITFVGLDVHKEAIDVAVLLPWESRPVEWPTSNEQGSIRRMVRKLARGATPCSTPPSFHAISSFPHG
jgi:hypothetical protein